MSRTSGESWGPKALPNSNKRLPKKYTVTVRDSAGDVLDFSEECRLGYEVTQEVLMFLHGKCHVFPGSYITIEPEES